MIIRGPKRRDTRYSDTRRGQGCCSRIRSNSAPGQAEGQDSEAGLTHGAPVPSLQRIVQGGDHDDTGNDTKCEEVDNEIQAAAVGEGEYGGIYDGDEDDVISALLALAEA